MRSGVRTARLVGLALGALVAVARRWRPRPLHPTGAVLAGTLRPESHDAPGRAALGAPVAHPVVVRVSRAAGLPTRLPDVSGLAVHWTAGDRSQDLLLSATGPGWATRFLLAPRPRPLAGGFGTLMPFRDTDGRPAGTCVRGCSQRASPWRCGRCCVTRRRSHRQGDGYGPASAHYRGLTTC